MICQTLNSKLGRTSKRKLSIKLQSSQAQHQTEIGNVVPYVGAIVGDLARTWIQFLRGFALKISFIKRDLNSTWKF